MQVKELLCDTPGVPDGDWQKSYDGSAGGIVTVLSELGEPIHKVANRGLMLWRELDRDIFSLPKDKMAAKIAEKKQYIIKKLNADFQKVRFPLPIVRAGPSETAWRYPPPSTGSMPSSSCRSSSAKRDKGR